MSILLKWSSPFLWPGYSIDYYNISVTNGGLTTYSHLINATFTDVLVAFMITADETNTESCHVMDILLSAISSDTNDLDTFRVNGGFIPSAKFLLAT